MDEGVDKYGWRENGECLSQVEAKRLSDASRNKICNTVQAKYPKKSMCAKAMVLNDLISQFAQRKSDPHSACREALKNSSLHVVKKPKLSVIPLRGENIKRAAAMLLNSANENQVSELVTVMKSSKFKIADPKMAAGCVVRGVSTLSCYDKVPREPQLDLSGAEALDCRPDVTRKLEDINIECDLTYNVSNTSVSGGTNCDELCKKVEDSSLQSETVAPYQLPQICDFSSRFRE